MIRRARSLWTATDAFGEHRLRTLLLALLTAAIGTVLLAIGPAPAESRFGAAWATVWAAVLSISIVTLLYELVLRESYAIALQRFVQLDSTVVRTGLRAIGEEADLDWEALFDVSTSVTFVLIRPYKATTYMHNLMRSARGRDVTIRFCFPDVQEQIDPDDDSAQALSSREYLATLAKATGSDTRLAAQISTAIEEIVATFELSSHQLGAGSTLEVALFKQHAFMEGAVLDRATVLMLIDGDGRPRGTPPVCALFTDSRSADVQRLRAGLEAVSKAATKVEDKRAHQGMKSV